MLKRCQMKMETESSRVRNETTKHVLLVSLPNKICTSVGRSRWGDFHTDKGSPGPEPSLVLIHLTGTVAPVSIGFIR